MTSDTPRVDERLRTTSLMNTLDALNDLYDFARQLERELADANAKLAAKPDVAGLVKRLREGDHGFDRNGSHSEDRYVCLCEHLANEAADALLSLSAQLAEKEAECEGKQAKIDALMLEYCPNEMSAEQVARWAGCQVGSGELLPTDAARKP